MDDDYAIFVLFFPLNFLLQLFHIGTYESLKDRGERSLCDSGREQHALQEPGDKFTSLNKEDVST